MSESTEKETPNLIEFHGPLDLGDPVPFRAVEAIPDWLKHMETAEPGPGNEPIGTAKRCPPLVDAISCGYIIPLRRTIRFMLRDAETLLYESVGDNEVVSGQERPAYQGAPFEKSIVIKFRNSWIVKTPPGYSTLFLPVLNRVDFPFHVLSGLVDTDVFYRETVFPSVCLMKPGSEVILEKGTPLVQAIPFKREAWQLKIVNWDVERRLESEVDFMVTRQRYKRKHWQKKEYR